MRILITGACGFIGSHLADEFVSEGHAVTGIDDLSTGREENFPKGGRLVIGDITNKLSFQDKFDVIYHCAASYKDRNAWERDARTNVLGTINVVREAAKHHARLIYFQTSLCYGPSPISPVKPNAPLDPRGSYAVSKTAGESYIKDSGLTWVSLRLANIYGPRNLSGPVPTFFKRLSEGKLCTVVESRRDFVFIDDLVRIAKKAATRGHGVYHVASGQDVSILEMYEYVGEAMRIEFPEPDIVPRGADDVATLLLDPSETFEEFGWSVRTPFHTGIQKAVTWYQTHGVEETYTHLALKG